MRPLTGEKWLFLSICNRWHFYEIFKSFECIVRVGKLDWLVHSKISVSVLFAR